MDPRDPPNRRLPPAGWYPNDGALRWWDGLQWTVHTAPAAAAATAQSGVNPQTSPTETAVVQLGAVPVVSDRPGPAMVIGWGGLVLVAVLGLASSGVSGLLVLSGLYVLVVAVIALIRGRVDWSRLRGRAGEGLLSGPRWG